MVKVATPSQSMPTSKKYSAKQRLNNALPCIHNPMLYLSTIIVKIFQKNREYTAFYAYFFNVFYVFLIFNLCCEALLSTG